MVSEREKEGNSNQIERKGEEEEEWLIRRREREELREGRREFVLNFNYIGHVLSNKGIKSE